MPASTLKYEPQAQQLKGEKMRRGQAQLRRRVVLSRAGGLKSLLSLNTKLKSNLLRWSGNTSNFRQNMGRPNKIRALAPNSTLL